MKSDVKYDLKSVNKFNEKKFNEEMKKWHNKEIDMANKRGFVEAFNPHGWMPMNATIAVKYLSTISPKLKLLCPNCGKPLTLRYGFSGKNGEKMLPYFYCNGTELDHCRMYRVIKNKLVPAE